jgi:nucleoside-diphosphate-sugar epimerase
LYLLGSLPDNTAMPARKIQELILVTGASGQVGSEVCRALRAAKSEILPVDLVADPAQGVIPCDLRQKDDVAKLWRQHPVGAVIHLAAILPTAFRANPLSAAEVNLTGSVDLLRHAVKARVRRFIFVSSMAVYGLAPTPQPVTEEFSACPADPYGGSKRAIELIGETLRQNQQLDFISLRVSRVIGPGARNTSSPWRSQMFDPPPGLPSISIPYGAPAWLSLVHVEDVARMLVTLLQASQVDQVVYNTPAEQWQAGDLKQLLEESLGIRVELGPPGAHGGPTCDGGRFAREFGFQLRPLRDRLADRKRKVS